MFFAVYMEKSLPLVEQKVGKNGTSKLISRRLHTQIFCRINKPYEKSRAHVNHAGRARHSVRKGLLWRVSLA